MARWKCGECDACSGTDLECMLDDRNGTSRPTVCPFVSSGNKVRWEEVPDE